MPSVTRRQALQTGIAGIAALTASPASLLASDPPASAQATPTPATPTSRRNNIHQSVSRWCYQKIPLDDLCAYSAKIGLKAVDLLGPEEYEIPGRHGLVCSMAYAGGGEIPTALNRVENHARIEEGF